MSFHYDEIRQSGRWFTFIDMRHTERPGIIREDCFKRAVTVDEDGPVDFHIFNPVVTTSFNNALTGEHVGEKVEWVDVPASVKRRFNRWAKYQ